MSVLDILLMASIPFGTFTIAVIWRRARRRKLPRQRKLKM